MGLAWPGSCQITPLPFWEAEPPTPSLGFVFPTALPTGACWPRAQPQPGYGRLWSYREVSGQRRGSCPWAAADECLLPPWGSESCGFNHRPLPSHRMGWAEGTRASSGLQEVRGAQDQRLSRTDPEARRVPSSLHGHHTCPPTAGRPCEGLQPEDGRTPRPRSGSLS